MKLPAASSKNTVTEEITEHEFVITKLSRTLRRKGIEEIVGKAPGEAEKGCLPLNRCLPYAVIYSSPRVRLFSNSGGNS
jgi:hypothetical protein